MPKAVPVYRRLTCRGPRGSSTARAVPGSCRGSTAASPIGSPPRVAAPRSLASCRLPPPEIPVQRNLGMALYVVAHKQRGRLVDLDAHLAVGAAELSAESGLPMADSVILATARAEGAVL